MTSENFTGGYRLPYTDHTAQLGDKAARVEDRALEFAQATVINFNCSVFHGAGR